MAIRAVHGRVFRQPIVRPVGLRRGCRVPRLDIGDNRWCGTRGILRNGAGRRSDRRAGDGDGHAPVHRRHIRIFRLHCGDASIYFNSNTDTNRYSNCHTDSYSNSDSNSNATATPTATPQPRHSDRDTHGNRHCNGKPDRNTDCYYYAYSKAYRNTETSFYTAASRNTEAKTLIAPVAVQVALSKKRWLLASNAEPAKVETSCV